VCLLAEGWPYVYIYAHTIYIIYMCKYIIYRYNVKNKGCVLCVYIYICVCVHLYTYTCMCTDIHAYIVSIACLPCQMINCQGFCFRRILNYLGRIITSICTLLWCSTFRIQQGLEWSNPFPCGWRKATNLLSFSILVRQSLWVWNRVFKQKTRSPEFLDRSKRI